MKRRYVLHLLAARPAGQTMAEFAAAAFAFLVLLFGIMEIALAVNAYNDVSTAAREAARYAMIHSPTSANNPCPSGTQCKAVATIAERYAPFLSDTDVTTTFTDPDSATEDYAVVQIAHTYPLTIPFMSTVNLSLSASSQMLVSQ